MQLIDKIHQFGIFDSCKGSRLLHADKISLTHITKLKTLSDATGEVLINYGTIEKLDYGNKEKLILSWNQKYLNFHGSLPKYLFGNNLNLLTLNQAKEVFDDLSGKLGIDLSPSIISQLDTAFDLELQLPVKSYYSFLGPIKGMMRTPTDKDSLYYSNLSKADNLYDKIKALSKEGFTVSEIKNLMRFEKRDKTASLKRIIKKFGLDVLTVADFLRRDIYSEFIRDLLREYEAITKKQSFYYNPKPNCTPNDIIRLNAAENICNIGLEEYYARIENTKSLGLFRRKEYPSIAKGIGRNLSKSKNNTKPYPAIIELDDEIHRIAYASLLWVPL